MAITYNYTYPATGATAPTATQVANQNEVICQVTTDGALTTFTITHNLGISAADLTLGYPHVWLEPTNANAANGTNAAFIASKTTNTVVFTCLATVATYNVAVNRESTLVR